MSDLPARLRRASHDLYFNKPELSVEAAERIEELEADLLAAETHILSLAGQVAELQADIDQCPFHGPVARWDLP